MKIVSCLIASGFASPFFDYQDSLGQYSFGYSAPESARSEVRMSNGATRGAYSYIDETGVIQTTQYVADGKNGFRVFATNLPQAPLPVQDTPEVMAARTAHLQALEMAMRRDEQAQSLDMNQEGNAQKRKLEGNQSDANLGKTQKQLEAQLSLKEKNKNAEKVKLKKNESLQAVASRSDIDKTSENSQNIHEESSGKATEKIIGGANIPAILSIFPHMLLPQAPNENAMLIFPISLRRDKIENIYHNNSNAKVKGMDATSPPFISMLTPNSSPQIKQQRRIWRRK